MSTVNEHDTCLQCGYSLQMLTHEQACPECGKSVRESRIERRLDKRGREARLKIFERLVSAGLILFGLFIIGTFVFSELTTCHVTARELSPDTFDIRIRSWYEVPFVRWRLSADKLTTEGRLPLGHWLIVNNEITATTASQTWLTYQQTPRGIALASRPSPYYGAGYQVFNELRYNAGHWEQWSKQHPTKAKILWPLIRRELLKHGEDGFHIVDHVLDLTKQQPSTLTDDQFEKLLEDAVAAM